MKEVVQKNGDELQPLKGTPQEIGQQFIELAKTRHLTPEAIQAITPLSTPVLESIGTALKESVKNANNTSNSFFGFFDKQMNLYSEMLKNGNLSEGDKRLVYEQLSIATELVYKYSHDTTIGWQSVVGFLGTVLTIFLGIVLIMAGGKKEMSAPKA